MLIGSQLKNAQLEVVATLPTTDVVKGRIVYLYVSADHANNGLWMHNGSGWERIIDPGLFSVITGESEAGAGVTPTSTHTLSSLDGRITSNDTDIGDNAALAADNAALAAANAANIVDIKDGSDSIFDNKTPPQEMCHTWNVNGRLDSVYGYTDSVDGTFSMPWDAEITAFTCDLYNQRDWSTPLVIDLRIYNSILGYSDSVSESCFTSNISLDGNSIPTLKASYMKVRYTDATTGAINHTAALAGTAGGVTQASTGGSVYPQWSSSAKLNPDSNDRYKIRLISGPAKAEDFQFTLFFRRKTL